MVDSPASSRSLQDKPQPLTYIGSQSFKRGIFILEVDLADGEL